MVTCRRACVSGTTVIAVEFTCRECGSHDYSVIQSEARLQGEYPMFALLCKKCSKPSKVTLSFPRCTNSGIRKKWKSMGLLESSAKTPMQHFSLSIKSSPNYSIILTSESPVAYSKRFDNYAELLSHLASKFPVTVNRGSRSGVLQEQAA